MGVDTKIQWCSHSFNPWRGCSRVSEGCRFCYAETLSHRNPGVLGVWGDKGTRVVASEVMWREPLKWDREAAAAGERRRVFCASLADVFEDRPELVSPRQRLLRLMHDTPHLDWLLLTKRPGGVVRLIRECLDVDWPTCLIGGRNRDRAYWYAADWINGKPPANVWLGTSVEDQRRADERIPILNDIPARVRFISFEPLLGPIETQPDPHNLYGSIHWAIVGGESGPHARPCDLAWIRSIRDQCRSAGVPVFVKQLGARPVVDRNDEIGGGIHCDLPLKLRDSKGGDPAEWPEDFPREFPR